MSYEKTIWATGDVVTAEKLNHMEEGIEAGGSGGGAFIVTFTADRQGMEIKGIASIDKTFQEVIDALMSGKMVIAKLTNLPDYDHYINCTEFKTNHAVFSYVSTGGTSIFVETIDYVYNGEASYAQYTVS